MKKIFGILFLFCIFSVAHSAEILGKHMFSLQWIDGYGSAIVSKQDDGSLVIKAEHEKEGDYVLLNGNVTIINKKHFQVDGEVVTRVSHINNGVACTRKGVFDFKVTQNRKYWRMQQRENPCDPVADYVDVYFK